MFPTAGRGLLPALAVSLLAGCASLSQVPPLSSAEAGPEAEAFGFSGRIALRQQDHYVSGGIRWRHQAARDDILLLSPLGQGVMQIVRDTEGAALRTSDDKEYRAADAEQLAWNVTGWRIPVSGLVYWVRGVPRPGSIAHEERDAMGRLQLLTQDDWRIEYQTYADAPDTTLPRRMVLTRPEFEIKLVIDSWEPAAAGTELPATNSP
jgi:outer membrane lipoprotein LolB